MIRLVDMPSHAIIVLYGMPISVLYPIVSLMRGNKFGICNKKIGH